MWQGLVFLTHTALSLILTFLCMCVNVCASAPACACTRRLYTRGSHTTHNIVREGTQLQGAPHSLPFFLGCWAYFSQGSVRDWAGDSQWGENDSGMRNTNPFPRWGKLRLGELRACAMTSRCLCQHSEGRVLLISWFPFLTWKAGFGGETRGSVLCNLARYLDFPIFKRE